MAFFDFLRKKSLRESAGESTPSGADHGENEERRVVSISLPRRKKMRLTEAFGIFPFGDPDFGTEFSDKLFVNLRRAGPLDLEPNRMQTAQRLSTLLYFKNPRAKRAIELVKDFVLGEGFRVVAKEPKVQEILDEHVRINEWDDKAEERLRGIALFGELLMPAFVNDVTGMVKVTTVEPLKIRQVDAHPENSEDVIRIRTTVRQPGEKNGRKFDVIRLHRGDELVGDAFYFTINRIPGMRRGVPDLLSSIDWLEGLDGFLFGALERADISQQVVIDLLFKSLNAKEIGEEVDKFVRSVQEGGVWGHNENVELTIKSPNLGAADIKGMTQVIKSNIQAGTGIPGLGFGDAADLTRSSAEELTVPVARMIEGRQRFFRLMMRRIFDFQIQESLRAGTIPKDIDTAYQIELAKVFLRDTAQITRSITELSQALELGVQSNWISNDQAGALYRGALQQIGPMLEAPSEEMGESLSPDERHVAVDLARLRAGRTGNGT